eukprot:SAG22_NODE_588_length_8842_cov_33.853254_3_plen_66_part_00
MFSSTARKGSTVLDRKTVEAQQKDSAFRLTSTPSQAMQRKKVARYQRGCLWQFAVVVVPQVKARV